MYTLVDTFNLSLLSGGKQGGSIIKNPAAELRGMSDNATKDHKTFLGLLTPRMSESSVIPAKAGIQLFFWIPGSSPRMTKYKSPAAELRGNLFYYNMLSSSPLLSEEGDKGGVLFFIEFGFELFFRSVFIQEENSTSIFLEV